LPPAWFPVNSLPEMVRVPVVERNSTAPPRPLSSAPLASPDWLPVNVEFVITSESEPNWGKPLVGSAGAGRLTAPPVFWPNCCCAPFAALSTNASAASVSV
jgi:hypothetical protein